MEFIPWGRRRSSGPANPLSSIWSMLIVCAFATAAVCTNAWSRRKISRAFTSKLPLGTLFVAPPPHQFADGGADVIREIERGHRHLAVVRGRKIAGHPVEIDGELARGLGVEQLAEPRADHPAQDVAGAARRHTCVAGRVDEDLLVGCRDERAMPFQHDVRMMAAGEIAGDLQPA